MILIGQAQLEAQEPLDKLVLRSGGELYGKIIDPEKKENGENFILFETELGGIVQLRSQLVRSTIPVDTVAKSYADRAKIANDAKSHWDVVLWCQTQKGGKLRFRDEIRFHLREIVKDDPNDEKAWRKLGYERRDGVWGRNEEVYSAFGYVKHKGKWKSKQAMKVAEQLAQMDQQRRAGKIAVNKWYEKWKKPGQLSLNQVENELNIIMGPAVIAPLFELAKENNNPRFRGIVINQIGTVPTATSLNALVYFAVNDPDIGIRDRAATMLQQKHFDKDQIVVLMLRQADNFLGSPNNNIVQRSGQLLGQLNIESAIRPLIGALRTKHIVAPGTPAGSLGATSVNGQIQGLNAGGGEKPREMMIANQAVAGALRQITGQDLGSEEAWNNWYIDNYGYRTMNVRVDDD